MPETHNPLVFLNDKNETIDELTFLNAVNLKYDSTTGWLAISVTKNCVNLKRKRKCGSLCLEDTDRLFIDSCHNELPWEYEKLLFTEIVGSRSRFGWPGMSTFDLKEKVSLKSLNSIRRGHQNVLRA